MTISTDPQHRWWIEVSGVNPHLVTQFRPSLLAYIGFGSQREAQLAGTGFITAGTPDYALAITAKHVLFESVLRIQRPAPSTQVQLCLFRQASRLHLLILKNLEPFGWAPKKLVC
jgi:hypothetical protein